MIHVRFEGRSYDFDLAELPLNAALTDQTIKQRVAQKLDVGLDRLASYVVDRSPTGHVIVRPEALYG
ncbi:MAG: hypothetical protein KF901_19005 [Myxococcales bacterium]|nr:hypothetical protein [Myxococcales bacterium]